jgi:hypothetical protein
MDGRIAAGRAFTFCHQKESASVSLVDHERVALALYAAARVSCLLSRRPFGLGVKAAAVRILHRFWFPRPFHTSETMDVEEIY